MSGEKVRLLVCHHCESVEEIPWCGEVNCNHPQCNDALAYRVARHHFGDGRAHFPANLADIDKAAWDKYSTRQDVLLKLKQIVNPGAGVGLGETLYDVRNNFEQDAMMCWKKEHKRTPDCPMFRHEKKRLVPQDEDTMALRRDLHLETRTKHRPTMTYLCDFCPVRSMMETRQQAKKFGFEDPYK